MNKLFKDIRHSDVDAVRVAISKNITVVNEVYTAKAPKKDGKGNPYVDVIRGHVSLLDAATSASRKVFRDAFIR